MSFKAIFAAVALLLAPLSAKAVVIAPGDTAFVALGDTAIGSFAAPEVAPVVFTFEATEAVRVSGAATMLKFAGFGGPASLLYGRTGFETAVAFDTLGTNAGFVLPSITLAAGESVSAIFNFSSLDSGSGGQVSIDTALVPLPAAGWLLLSALGGVTFISRRRKAA